MLPRKLDIMTPLASGKWEHECGAALAQYMQKEAEKPPGGTNRVPTLSNTKTPQQQNGYD